VGVLIPVVTGLPEPPLHVNETVVDQVFDAIVDDTIEGQPAFVPFGHQLQSSQNRELLASDREREIEGVGEISHAELVVGQGVHDRKPHWARQRPEDLSGVLQDLAFWKRAACCDDLRPVDHLGEIAPAGNPRQRRPSVRLRFHSLRCSKVTARLSSDVSATG